MAILKNPCDKDFRGTIDKLVVVRQYSGERTVISSYPDMSGIKPTMAQRRRCKQISKNGCLAKVWFGDPSLKRHFERRIGKKRVSKR